MIAIALGCILALSWPGAQAGPKPMTPDPHVRKVCVEELDVRVGDAFEKVEKAVTLAPDPAGTATDFVAARGPERSIDGGTLRSTLHFAFDGRRRLRSVTIAWRWDGEQTARAREAIVEALAGQIHPCFKAHALGEVAPGRHEAQIHYGTYSERLVFDATDGWHISYTIEEQP
jgi:hypothetical protein